jgi:hypothetical protein
MKIVIEEQNFLGNNKTNGEVWLQNIKNSIKSIYVVFRQSIEC